MVSSSFTWPAWFSGISPGGLHNRCRLAPAKLASWSRDLGWVFDHRHHGQRTSQCNAALAHSMHAAVVVVLVLNQARASTHPFSSTTPWASPLLRGREYQVRGCLGKRAFPRPGCCTCPDPHRRHEPTSSVSLSPPPPSLSSIPFHCTVLCHHQLGVEPVVAVFA